MAESGVAGAGLAVRGSALLFRRMALVELAVLVVILFHEEPENECFISVNSGAGLFAVAPLLSGITRVARARLQTVAGRACCRSIATLSNCWVAERWPGCLRLGVPPDAVCDGGVMLTIATALPVVTVGSPLPSWAI